MSKREGQAVRVTNYMDTSSLTACVFDPTAYVSEGRNQDWPML